MKTMNYKSVRKETKNATFRKIKTPKGHSLDHTRYMSKPFHKQFMRGNFKNDIYSSYSPLFIAMVYIKNLAMFLVPAFMLFHAPLLLIKYVNTIALGEELMIASEDTFLIVIYGLPFIFAMNRINNRMAYYNVNSLVGKHNLNQLVQSSMHAAANKEFAVMNHYRMKFNKVNLFTSPREMAIEEQLFEKELAKYGHSNAVVQFAHARKHALSMNNKTAEHYAAKAIADQNQAKNGGVNEYDRMVRKYKHRTTPEIRELIKYVQNK